MNPLETLAALSRGDPAAGRGLLPAVRAQAFGAEAFGGEAAVALFARGRAPLSHAPDALVVPRAAAVFDVDAHGAEQVVFADAHPAGLSRVWRLGPGPTDEVEAEPPLAVASDPFLHQRRTLCALRLEDHPAFDPAAAEALREVAAAVALGPDADAPAAGGLALVLRAFTIGDRSAALFAVAGLAPGEPRLAAAAFRVAAGRLAHLRLVWDADRRPPCRAAV